MAIGKLRTLMFPYELGRRTHSMISRVAAATLFEMLVLKTQGFIDLEQSASFGNITISPTDRLYAHSADSATAALLADE